MTATLPKGKANIWGVRKKTREQGMYDLDRMFSAQSAVHSAADEVMDIYNDMMEDGVTSRVMAAVAESEDHLLLEYFRVVTAKFHHLEESLLRFNLDNEHLKKKYVAKHVWGTTGDGDAEECPTGSANTSPASRYNPDLL